MALLPQRKKKVRSGILRAPKREWKRHEAWVRGHKCGVPALGALASTDRLFAFTGE